MPLTTNPMPDVYAMLAEARVNVELMFTNNEDDGFLITCRIRPWKAPVGSDRMILAGGRTVTEAVYWAARGYSENLWTDLDWRGRAMGVGVVHPKPRLLQAPLPSLAPMMASDDLFPVDVDTEPQTPKKMRQKAAQERHGQTNTPDA